MLSKIETPDISCQLSHFNLMGKFIVGMFITLREHGVLTLFQDKLSHISPGKFRVSLLKRRFARKQLFSLRLLE
jgi:hypothetical protein